MPLLLSAPPGAAAEDRSVVAGNDDAYVAALGKDVYAIGTTGLELTVGLSASGTLSIQGLRNPTADRDWDLTPGPDTSIVLNGERFDLGNSTVVAFVGATPETTDNGVRLTFTFEHRATHTRIQRIYACYPRAPAVEVWTRFDAAAATTVIQASALAGWQLTMAAGTVQWLDGLKGDGAEQDADDPFRIETRDLEPDEQIYIGSSRRSSEEFVPFARVDGGQDIFYGGVMWSGSWQIAFTRRDDNLSVAASFPGTTRVVSPSRAMEIPHTFFGIVPQSASGPSAALREFIVNGIRHGRPFTPLVTYNSWYPYGADVNEDSIQEEIRFAERVGIELVVLDAGWWFDAGATDPYDFTSGLGSWKVDDDRFPSGLGSLSAYAHEHGVKFGLWVEPGRVALSTVDQPGLAREAWLATIGGSYGSNNSAQLCLNGAAGRQWVRDRLVAIIDAAQPDYLKWDNNFWLNCDRPGHGHGGSDGNMSAVEALYDLLDELRARYPDLLIENVSGGGNRLDFGIIGHTDTAWMDDRTAPSIRVRHNLEGLSSVFPPAYLLSFVIDSESDPLIGDDLPLLVRSRMPGLLGFTYRAGEISDDLANALAGEIARYKSFRDTVADGAAILLSDQAPIDGQPWDIVEGVTNDGLRAVVLAYKADASDGQVIVRPRNLVADATYDASSIDLGPMGSARGDLIMRDGIAIDHAGGSRAHIITLRAR